MDTETAYKKGVYRIESNEPLTRNVWRMVLAGDTRWITAPGQFVNIALEGRYLRRPISVCDYDEHTITLIYKVVGGGTEQMSRMAAGAELDLLTGLGNGFSIRGGVRRPLLVGGGVGVPPLYNLARKLLAEGREVQVVTPEAFIDFEHAQPTNTFNVAVSQSGYSTNTIAALDFMAEHDLPCAALTANWAAPISEHAVCVFDYGVGVESVTSSPWVCTCSSATSCCSASKRVSAWEHSMPQRLIGCADASVRPRSMRVGHLRGTSAL